jgi:peptide deformylase
MIYPIVAYGDPILRKVADEVDENYADLQKIIDDMFETMYKSSGVGLAAPQIGKSIRVFVIDAEPFAEDEPGLENFKKVFINPIMIEEFDEKWSFNEGCLSIPKVREDVERHRKITIEYYNENFELVEETYEGLAARIIQHEYDHLEGVLFVDRIPPLKKKMLEGKLREISRGLVKTDYKMKFPKRK